MEYEAQNGGGDEAYSDKVDEKLIKSINIRLKLFLVVLIVLVLVYVYYFQQNLLNFTDKKQASLFAVIIGTFAAVIYSLRVAKLSEKRVKSGHRYEK